MTILIVSTFWKWLIQIIPQASIETNKYRLETLPKLHNNLRSLIPIQPASVNLSVFQYSGAKRYRPGTSKILSQLRLHYVMEFSISKSYRSSPKIWMLSKQLLNWICITTLSNINGTTIYMWIKVKYIHTRQGPFSRDGLCWVGAGFRTGFTSGCQLSMKLGEKRGQVGCNFITESGLDTYALFILFCYDFIEGQKMNTRFTRRWVNHQQAGDPTTEELQNYKNWRK